MNPGIDNKPFEMKIYELPKDNTFGNYCIGIDPYAEEDSKSLGVISKPVKTHWFYSILYYLSLGLYDRRGYSYKVKTIK